MPNVGKETNTSTKMQKDCVKKNCALKRLLDTIKVEHDETLAHDKLLCKRFYMIKFFKGTIQKF